MKDGNAIDGESMKHILNTALIRQRPGYCALSLAILVKSLHAALSYRKKALQKNQRCSTVFVRPTKLGTESSGVGAGLSPEKVSLGKR